MPRHRRDFAGCSVHVDGMIRALAKQFAPVLPGAERGRGASSRQAERLANDVPTTERFLGQRPITLKDQTNCVDEIERACSSVSPWVLAPGSSSTNAI